MKMMGMDVGEEEENYEIHSDEGEELDEDGLPLACRICE